MFSDTYTGTCCLPLCTAIVRPMKSGMIVERRDHVLIGFLSLVACAASTFFIRWASQNGPYINERVMCYPLFLAAARDDHRSRALIATRLLALGLLTPWRYRMTTCSGAALAATVRVVDRVHDHAAHSRTHAAPTHCTGLADLAKIMFSVADLANGRAAFDMHATHFAGTQTPLRVSSFARHQYDCRVGGVGFLRALAWQHFYAMHRGADRNVSDRQAIASLDRRFGAVHQLITDRHALACDDVFALAICVADHGDVCAAVRIIFNALNLGSDSILVTAEIDHTVLMLMPAAGGAGGGGAGGGAAGARRRRGY